MNSIQRHDAVRQFHSNPTIKIMIAGLKVGGQALNLTCANRVISSKSYTSSFTLVSGAFKSDFRMRVS
jgi:hypothetical protein